MRVGAKTNIGPDRLGFLKSLTGMFDFIEVYVTDDRLPISQLKELDTRWIVHGPHIGHGVNLPTLDDEGRKKFRDFILLASDLGAKYVIAHSGVHVSLEEREKLFPKMIENALEMKDFARDHGTDIIIENTIYRNSYAVDIGMTKQVPYSFGTTPEDIRKIKEEVNSEFLLDFAHAMVTANNLKLDQKKFVSEMASLNPAMFHICDGHLASLKDEHLNLGEGEYDMKFFASLIGDRDVTFEIGSGKPATLEDFVKSLNHLKSMGLVQ